MSTFHRGGPLCVSCEEGYSLVYSYDLQCSNLGVVVTLERNILLRLQKQDFKNIKDVKGCRDGMPKSMQTR